MQAVIFAAGEGTRMRPLTLETPKPLIKVGGVPILDHIARALPLEVEGLLLVVGYKADQIRAHCGTLFHGHPVHYVTQEQMLGTAHALACCKDTLRGKFLVMAGDDIHGPDALARLVKHDLALLVAESDHPERFGVVSLKPDGTIDRIIEKPANPPTNLVSTGVMVLDERIFSYVAPKTESGEYYLPDLLTQLAADVPVAVERQDLWIPIGYPEDIPRAEAILANR